MAILIVVISHYGLKNVIPGGFGVTLFFFISGFLITRLLLAEFAETQRIDLRGFYIRRVLRLYPALLVMVTLSVLFTVGLGCGFQPDEVLSTLFYYRNYYMVYGREVMPTPVVCSLLYDITWSLSIEEHFYLLFPLLFLALARYQRTLLVVMGGTIISVLLWRMYIVTTQGATDFVQFRLYHSSDTRLDAIMYGCFISLGLHLDRSGRFLAAISRRWVVMGALGLLLLSFLIRDAGFREIWRYSFQGLALSVLLPTLLYTPRYTSTLRWINVPWLIYVGKLSYSIYLFHWVGVCIAIQVVGEERLTLPWLLTASASGLLLSLGSYHYVEKPTARLRKRFGSTVQLATRSNQTQAISGLSTNPALTE